TPRWPFSASPAVAKSRSCSKARSCRACSCRSRSRSTIAARPAPTAPASPPRSCGASSAPSSFGWNGDARSRARCRPAAEARTWKEALMPDDRDTWSSGDAYEPYVGRWSRLFAVEFLRLLDAPGDPRGLHAGSGPAALSEAIVARCSPDAVVGVDRSEEYLGYARSRVSDPRVSFQPGDAQALPVKDYEHDIVVSGLMLNFVPY